MNRVIAVVEGRTERTFLDSVVAPWLGARGVVLSARIVGKPNHKGGVGTYQRAKRDLLALLKQESTTFVTTMFDFFGMPSDWPGRRQAASAAHDQQPRIVENAILQDVAQTIGAQTNVSRIIPYVQMYEFEAFVFVDPPVFSAVTGNRAAGILVQAIRDEFQNPEMINDNPNTCPSRRLINAYAQFNKALHGVVTVQRTGLEKLRAACPHFHEWVTRLEQLGNQGSP